MSSVARSVPPPTQQEIQRKLSIHSVAKPIIKPTREQKKPKPTLSTAPVSGTESDSDSVFSPDAISPSPLSTASFGGPGIVGSSSQPPLSAIAEDRSGSGEESEEDEEDGGWHVETHDAIERSALEETVLKTSYLWKKGERRKTWKKRWFVLRPAHLAFYKTSAEYKLLRLLDLSDIHTCTPVSLKKHANTFGLVSPTRTFYLQAESPQDMQEWVKAVTNAKNNLLATSTQTSATAPIPIPDTGKRTSYHGGPPLSASPSSHSPLNHHLTSSDSDDAASPNGPLSFSTTSTPVIPSAEVSSPPAKQLQPGATTTAGAQKPEAPKVILAGYLMKCGSRRHTWHNRWFVLTADRLYYCRSHMDTSKPHRQIPLSQILDALEVDVPPPKHAHAVSPPGTSSPHHHPGNGTSPADFSEKLQSHTFKIVSPKKAYLLSAPSEEEEIRWLSAVRALIARRAGSGAVPGDGHGSAPPPSTTGTGTGAGGPNAPAPVTSKSAPLPRGVLGGGNEIGGSGTSAPSTGREGKRRDSFARRLSLSGGPFAGSGHSSSASAPPSSPAHHVHHEQQQQAMVSERQS